MTTASSVDTTSDSVLFEQLRSGNANGLAELYARYHDRLLRYCIGLLNDRSQAQDVVQNVFLKLHTRQESIRNGQSLERWVFTVARNEAYNELGRKKPVELSDAVVWNGESPDDALLSGERKDIIDTALRRMHLSYREVILLRVYEQLSYDEIAGITGTTVSSVKSRLYKARKALILKLRPYFNMRSL